MNRSLKNLKYRNKTKKQINTKDINVNLKGGTNLIDIILNRNSDNDDNLVPINSKDNNIVKSSEEILEKWITHTDSQEGVTLYFVKEENDEKNYEVNTNQNWLSGYHGKALKNDYKLKFNDYIKEKLKKSENIDSQCSEEFVENVDSNCQESLTQIQIDDINTITKRININHKVNNYLKKWLEFNNNIIKNKEQEIINKMEEMKTELEEKKSKIEAHTQNINNLITQNCNYNTYIKQYIGDKPDYDELQIIDKKNFEIDDTLIKYVDFSLKNHQDQDLNKELDF